MSRVISASLPVVLWMAFIFIMSTDLGSASNSGRIIGPILRWFNPAVTQQTIEQVQFIVRKGGHVAEYAVLAILVLRAVALLTSWRTLSSARGVFIAVAVSTIYAATDEFHQSFVASRGASLGDVALDAAGAVLGVVLAFTWRLCFRPFQRAQPAV